MRMQRRFWNSWLALTSLLLLMAAGKRYFALRSFDAASNRSEISNLSETEVR